MQVWAEFSSHLHDLTSRGHQRDKFWGLRNNESFCEAIVSVDSKFQKKSCTTATVKGTEQLVNN